MFETVAGDRYALTDSFVEGSTGPYAAASDLAALPNGGFVAVWYENGAVHAQTFNDSGEAVTANAVIAASGSQPNVTALKNGDYVVSWVQMDTYPANAEVHVQIFGADGHALSSDFIANTTSVGFQEMPIVTALTGGGFVVTWDNRDSDNGEDNVRGQVFGTDGTRVGGEFIATDSKPGDKVSGDVVALAGGGFVIGWFAWAAEVEDSWGNLSPGSRAQLFDESGNKVGSAFAINSFVPGYQQAPVLAALPSGGFVAAYTDVGLNQQDTGHRGIWVQIFDSSGQRIGTEIRANSLTAAAQGEGAITVVPGTGFLVTWSDNNVTDVNGIASLRAQLFDFTGDKLGAEFAVNPFEANGQREPHVVALDNGALAFAWSNWSTYPGEFKIRMLFPVTHGSDGDDTLTGGDGRDFIMGHAGNDIIHSGADADGLSGDDGNDLLDGGTGADLLDGGSGDDTYVVDNVADTVTELANGGHDIIQSSVDYTLPANVEDLMLVGTASLNGTGNDLPNVIVGTSAANVLVGGDGNDVLRGDAGDDVLRGGGGSDTLQGGLGHDALTGGTGNDTFIDTASNFDGDTITDFSAGDRIVFTDADIATFVYSIDGNTLTYSGGSLTFTKSLTGEIVVSAAASGGVELTLKVDAANDFNGDNHSDVVWMNAAGTVRDWLGQDSGAFAGNTANLNTTVPADWHVVATGDFNGDGYSDIMWENEGGIVRDWLGQANGGFTGNVANLNVTMPNDWHVVGTGDFNGDGRADILWRNDGGMVREWLGQSNGAFAGNTANFSVTVPTDWKIAGTGDFNGDGFSDILWRSSDGTVRDWLGTANGSFTGNTLNLNTLVTNDWHVVGTGDFNGDGYSDVLWRSQAGTVREWLGQANGGFSGNTTNLNTTVTTDWHVVSIADFNGDGIADLLWQNTGGSVREWLGQSNGSFVGNTANVNVTVPADWHVQDPFVHDTLL